MNIFNDSNYSSQSAMPSDATFNSMTSNNIVIPASTPGDVLFIGNQKQITGLQIGPNKYLLESNGSQPAWTNALDINSIKSTQYTIPGTTHGDLFTVNNLNNLERVPIGASGDILTSNGTEFFWQALDLPNPLNIQNLTLTNGTLSLSNSVIADPNKQYFYVAGTGGNINSSGSTPVNGFVNVINGRIYKVHYWGKMVSAVPVSLSLALNGLIVDTFTNDGTSPISFVLIWAAPTTGAISVAVNGVASSGSASLLGSWFTIESW